MHRTRRTCLAAVLLSCLIAVTSCTDSRAENIMTDFNGSDSRIQKTTVTPDTIVTIGGMSDQYMYALRKGSVPARSIETESSSQEVLKFNDNTYVPVQDKNGNLTFKASDIGVTGKCEVIFVRLHDGNDDMKVSENDEPAYYYNDCPVYEEYYHIDFKTLGLDPSNIAITSKLLGNGSCDNNWGYVTLDHGTLSTVENSSGIFDFSAYSSINLYNTLKVTGESIIELNQELIITNPVTLISGIDVPLNAVNTIFRIHGDGKEYILEWIGPKDEWEIEPADFSPRTVSGTYLPMPVAYEESNTDEGVSRKYYIGTLNEDSLIDLKIYDGSGEYDPQKMGKIRLIEADTAEKEKISITEFAGNETIMKGAIQKYASWQNHRITGTEDKKLKIRFTVDKTDGSWEPELSMNFLHSYGFGTSSYSIRDGEEFISEDNDVLDMLNVRAPEGTEYTITITKAEK